MYIHLPLSFREGIVRLGKARVRLELAYTHLMLYLSEGIVSREPPSHWRIDLGPTEPPHDLNNIRIFT